MSEDQLPVQAGQAGMTHDSDPQITIIIPTRNESDNICPLLDRLALVLSDFSVETIFVDDSTDDTAQVVASASAHYPFPVRVRARPEEERNGLSGAVVDGMTAATGEWVCVMDADLQHPPETIIRMWEQAQKSGADIVVGSRQGDLFGPYGLSRARSLNSQLLTIFARTLFPRRLKNASDPLTGLFLVRREAVDVTSLRPDGFKILLEILVRNPGLQVSEVHFDFAPRHSGESKADVREGARFFRHLVLLRTTANLHLGRFLVVFLVSLAGNAALMAALVRWARVPDLASTFLSAEMTWIAVFFALEGWVFSEREKFGRRRRFWGYFLLVQITIFLVHLPLYYVLTRIVNLNPMLANSVSFIVVGLVRYLLSEQWVWTRSGMVWQSPSYFYNLHDLLQIESQVPLRELDYFATDITIEDIDIQIRVDRQGTPSSLPGGISYDDQLGRFGFGLAVSPGAYTQVVVSPLLERSPDFLYTNVIEPILRWRLVLLGYALVNAACVATEDQAMLVSAEQDLGFTISRLCDHLGYRFLADDLVILDANGKVYCYPKPVTVNPAMLNESDEKQTFSERLALAGQRVLYTRYARRFGLWLSNQDLPAATMNTYLQRMIPQPKHPLQTLFPETEILLSAELGKLVCVTSDVGASNDNQPTAVDRLQQSETIAGFQPHPLLAQSLRTWDEEDLLLKEQDIIYQALQDVPVLTIYGSDENWWFDLADGENSSIMDLE